MKKLFLFFIVLFSLQAMAQKPIPKPVPAKLVVDNANLLDSYDAQQLENKLVALDDSTSNQIAVVTVNSLNGQVIEDVATATFRDWGIGNKKTNNGVLLLISLEDRKIRIETGYGLEGAIPDVVASDIIENDLTPAFQQKNYYDGINKAVDDIAKAAVGEYHVKRKKVNNIALGIFISIFVGAIGIFFYLFISAIIKSIFSAKRKGNHNRKFKGKHKGRHIGAIIVGIVFQLFFIFLMGSFGFKGFFFGIVILFIIGIFISKRGGKSGNGWSVSSGGSGGDWSASSGGESFSGFGGGSSGGGGASGSW